MSIIDIVQKADVSYCKFLSANDTGETGGHQAGIYIPKDCATALTNVNIERGQNDKRTMIIEWDDGRMTDSVMTYYGVGSRNETRITCFGRDFPYLQKTCTGNLFIIAKISSEHFYATTLSTDDDIETFLTAFNISPTETNQLIKCDKVKPLEAYILEAIASINDFPASNVMSMLAQQLSIDAHQVNMDLMLNIPDKALLSWVEIEYSLFRELENKFYLPTISPGFISVEDFVAFANQVLNRRKSRAGHSLEHHLARIFGENCIQFEEQVVTEGNKRPDFIFPSSAAYHDPSYPANKLVFLGAKTTCKDRWRQVINEADRIQDKFLFTLQQGISSNQLEEMAQERVRLVVPEEYIKTYPPVFRDSIYSLKQFINYTKEVLL